MNLDEKIAKLNKDISNLERKVKKRHKVINFSVDLITNFISAGLIFFVIIKIEKNYLNINKISNIYNFFIFSFLLFSALYLSIKKYFLNLEKLKN